ncbi:MAG: hypothetical protein V4579_01560, partial [Pseudomonadota bacterium]
MPPRPRTRSAILEVPPFPGVRNAALHVPNPGGHALLVDPEVVISALCAMRVGGTFWGTQPRLPASGGVVATGGDEEYSAAKARASQRGLRLVWCGAPRPAEIWVPADADPWHLLAWADEVVAPVDEPLAVLAAFAGVPVGAAGEEPTLASAPARAALATQHLVAGLAYRDPFSGSEISVLEAIKLLGFWRALIDSNRHIGAVHGVGRWKRAAVGPLLWGGSEPVPFDLIAPAGTTTALWRARTDPALINTIERSGAARLEIEDGFVRSIGLGADCVPPLSIVVGPEQPHYDPSGPSGLERLLADTDFSPDLLHRAGALRKRIVEAGVSKYGPGPGNWSGGRSDTARRHILVTGQVEDDLSVQKGGGGIASNLDLVRRVRVCAPDAWIIYRPHPDVDAGHRRGHVDDASMLRHADAVERGGSITAWIDLADEVHVLTSLAGFEALLRGKPVTTHGVPFYAGWGLTTDLGFVPARRGRQRTLDELVAATLLIYPRYLDPLT